MGIKSPCEACSDRHVGCHCECSEYKMFRQEKDALNDTIRNNRNKFHLLTYSPYAATHKKKGK